MSNCFKNALSALSMRPYRSSTGHRNAQRINAGSEIISTSLSQFTPAAVIPTKIAQVLTSTYSLFRTDTNVPEKVIHFLEAGISATQVGLAITLLFQSQNCKATEGSICQAIFLTELLYSGILLTGWIPSEFVKDPFIVPAQQVQV
jgi:hypothetical protein